jgi:Uma2 family endonuclease
VVPARQRLDTPFLKEEGQRMVSVAPLLPPDVEEPDVSLLVTEDDTPLDGILTEKQERVLAEPLFSSWPGPAPAGDGTPRPFVVLANVGLFSTPDEQPVVPDVMLSLDVAVPDDLGEKKNRSYFLWRHGKPPEVVIEIVSNKKGGELEARRARYERVRVDFYVVYDPLKILGDVTLRAFELCGGSYVELVRPWFERVGLGLVEWDSTFEGVHRRWLRWCTRDGKVVPTGAERAAQERARADGEKARADEEKARSERLAARLRALGIDPDGDS